MAAADGARNRHLGPGAGTIEAGQLAGDARRIVVGHRIVELGERLLHPLLGRASRASTQTTPAASTFTG